MQCKLLFPIFAYVVQENGSENKVCDTLRPEMLYGPEHGVAVILHIAFGREIHDIQRYADTLGLHLL